MCRSEKKKRNLRNFLKNSIGKDTGKKDSQGNKFACR